MLWLGAKWPLEIYIGCDIQGELKEPGTNNLLIVLVSELYGELMGSMMSFVIISDMKHPGCTPGLAWRTAITYCT